MSEEIINIPTTKEKFFLQYLTIKSPIIDRLLIGINKREKVSLRDTPRRVLAELLYFNDTLKDLPEDQRWNIVFSTDTKKKICEKLKMKEHHLNIYISQLRTIGIIDGKKIRKAFVVFSGDELNLNFSFKLNGHS